MIMRLLIGAICLSVVVTWGDEFVCTNKTMSYRNGQIFRDIKPGETIHGSLDTSGRWIMTFKGQDRYEVDARGFIRGTKLAQNNSGLSIELDQLNKEIAQAEQALQDSRKYWKDNERRANSSGSNARTESGERVIFDGDQENWHANNAERIKAHGDWKKSRDKLDKLIERRNSIQKQLAASKSLKQ